MQFCFVTIDETSVLRSVEYRQRKNTEKLSATQQLAMETFKEATMISRKMMPLAARGATLLPRDYWQRKMITTHSATRRHQATILQNDARHNPADGDTTDTPL